MGTIDPELLKRLDAIAAKLGVTAQYLWSVLIRQGHIDGIMQVSTGGILIALAASLAFVSWRSTVKRTRLKAVRTVYGLGEPLSAGEEYSWSEDTAGWALMAPAIMAIVVLGVSIPFFYDGISELLNPAFYAFQHIGDLIR